jgi:hypothetical protein
MKYEVLFALSLVHPKPLTTDAVAKEIGVTPVEAQILLVSLMNYHDPYGSLVEMVKIDGVGGWRITGREDYDESTGGRGWLQEAKANPYPIENIARFKDEALTGTTASGKRSKLTNVALPTSAGASPRGYEDAETRAHATNQRLTVGKGG